MPLNAEQNKLADEVAKLVHQDKKRDAAKLISDVSGLGMKLLDDNPAKYNPILLQYLHILLENDAIHKAASILWTPSQFTYEPQCTRDVWELFETSYMGLIMGAGSMSKSYGMGVRFVLEWLRDPQYTSIKVVGPSEDHLEANLFSHLVRLHQSASLPMPGEVGELFMGFSRRDQLSSIRGVVIPVGTAKKSGRLQGTKRIPRPAPHPKFGPLSRLFVFIDEIENVPNGVWKDIDNILSQVTKEGNVKEGGFKIFGAYNPGDMTSEVAKRVVPPFGWECFDAESHFKWKSTRGWDVLRLDGERSENVIAGKIIFPGLQTRDGLEHIAANAGGKNSAGYFTMGRGCYPPQGIELALIPPGLLMKMRGEFIWLEAPSVVSSADLALEGGANCIYTVGECGRASGVKFPPTLEHPNGRTVMFKDRNGQPMARFGCMAKHQFTVPKGETVTMSSRIIELNKKAGTRPEYFCCDRTGIGSGVADLIKYNWSSAIHDINYSESASDTRIMAEDSKTCKESFDRLWSELWYALRSLGEFMYFLIHPNIDASPESKLGSQITQRKGITVGQKKKIESKKDYVSRGNPSPDEADSLTLFVHAVRKGSGIIFSMKSDTDSLGEFTGEDGWEEISSFPGGVRLDPTSRTDYLSEHDMQIL